MQLTCNFNRVTKRSASSKKQKSSDSSSAFLSVPPQGRGGPRRHSDCGLPGTYGSTAVELADAAAAIGAASGDGLDKRRAFLSPDIAAARRQIRPLVVKKTGMVRGRSVLFRSLGVYFVHDLTG